MKVAQSTGQPPLVVGQSSLYHFPPLTISSTHIPSSSTSHDIPSDMNIKRLDCCRVFSAQTLESKFVLPKDVEPIPVKPVYTYSWMDWTEVKRMKKLEFLQYAIVSKFVQAWSYLDDLRKNLPMQCDIKGDCKIGLMC